MATALRAADFIGTLGVNTHIDFPNYGYQNLTTTETAINYLGLKNLRDSPQFTSDLQTWKQVASATGAKFDAYIPSGSPYDMQNALDKVPTLAGQKILNFIEGGNEEDGAYAANLGNTLQITANFQKNSVWPTGQTLGLPVINMSFGAGWTADNGWIGDYASVGDLSAYATYGNAHTYPMPGQTPDSTIQRINGLAKLADSKDPVITTEIGWDRNQGYSQQTVAKYALDATMDGIKDGDAKMYFYALFDDGSGNFGLMNQNGTPMAAGTAIHNLTTLLSDKGTNASTFTKGSLNYTLSGKTSNDNTLLLQKSDGTYWISLWNEVDNAHNVTVNLPSVAADIKTFDPLTGTAATKDVKSASSVTVRMTDHPLLVEVVPSGTTPTSPPSVTTGAGSDSLVLHMAEDSYQGDAQFTVSIDGKQLGKTFTTTALQSSGVTQDFIFNGDWAVGSHTVTVNFLNDASGGTSTTDRNLYVDGAVYDGVNTGKTAALLSTGPWSFAVNDTTPISISPPTLQPNDLVINVPTSGDTVTAYTTSTLPGVSVTDPWAAQNAGSMALNLWDNSGAPLYVNGQQVTGTLSVTLTQLNADLAGLSYKAGGPGSDTVFVNVWNQAGVQDTESFGVTIKAASSLTLNTVTAAPADASPTLSASNLGITGGSGDRMTFIGGMDGQTILSGRDETAGPAGQGSNTIALGAGSSANALVTPAEGLSGLVESVVQSGGTIDSQPALNGIAWDTEQSALSGFTRVGIGDSNALAPASAGTFGTTASMDYAGFWPVSGGLEGGL